MTANDASGDDGHAARTEHPNEFYVMVRIDSSDEQELEIDDQQEDEIASDLDSINANLGGKKSGWRLDPEPRPDPYHAHHHRIVVPVKVTHPPQLTRQRAILSLSDLVDELRTPPVPIEIVLDPPIVRFPGHKPTHSMHPVPLAVGTGSPDGVMHPTPVAVVADAPPRGSGDTLPHGRRPVVALLDTKVERHQWLGAPGMTLGGDAFWVDAAATEHPWVPGPRLDPEPESREPAVYEGHGTFCAGLIRQLAPDAQVLAVHVARVHNRHVYGDHILNALGWLHHAGLAAGDVVCLPSGVRGMSEDDDYLDLLRRVLTRLTEHGIRVVAAAGNDGSSERVYPAAFASTGVADGDRLVSVGAYDTDGKTRAWFSNHGAWVTRWEIGTDVVSTFPAVDGAAAAGFARWSGTSFAAAIHAGRLVRHPVPPSEEAAPPATQAVR
jgi:hypothetical protein